MRKIKLLFLKATVDLITPYIVESALDIITATEDKTLVKSHKKTSSMFMESEERNYLRENQTKILKISRRVVKAESHNTTDRLELRR